MKAEKHFLIQGQSRAFTLMEVLVVLGIIVVVLLIVLAEYHQSKRNYLLQTSAQQLVADLRRAQNMALASMVSGTEVPLGGYGLYFNLSNPDSYLLFADKNDNGFYDSLPTEEKIEEVKLASGIVFNSLDPQSPLQITFQPPDPTTLINNNQDILQATVVLSIEGKSRTKSVTVTKTGLIKIE